MISNILYIGFFFGVLGTFIGGLIGIFINLKSQKALSCILEFAAGLMLAVVTFDLLPESFEFGGNYITILFFIVGIIVAIMLENLVNKISKSQIKSAGLTRNQCGPKSCNYNSKNYSKLNTQPNYNLLKTGILVGISLALHNFPEGLAIGSRFFCFA